MYIYIYIYVCIYEYIYIREQCKESDSDLFSKQSDILEIPCTRRRRQPKRLIMRKFKKRMPDGF